MSDKVDASGVSPISEPVGPSEATEDMLTVSQAAELLGVTPGFIYIRTRKNDIPITRTGPKTIRISKTALEAWTKERGGIRHRRRKSEMNHAAEAHVA